MVEFWIQYFAQVLLVIPTWVIFKKAGMHSALALFLLFPVVGYLVVLGILAFSKWPSIRSGQEV